MGKAPKTPRGRPLTYTKEIADKILEGISKGETMRDVCLGLDLSANTVRGWVLDDVQGFAVLYARAKELQLEAWADDMVAVATDSQRDTTTRGRDGEEYDVPDNEWINRSRLIIDTKKWLMCKIAPKKWGERVKTEISGPDDGPINVSWQT